MAEYPTMPLRTDALIADTAHLTAAEFGAYVRLLVAMWRNGATLPDDDKRLMRFAGMTAREWARSRDVLLAFMARTDDGQWTQKRLRKEWLAVTAKCDQAKHAVRSRWLKNKETGHTDVSSPQYARNTTQDPRSKDTAKAVSAPRSRGGFSQILDKGSGAASKGAILVEAVRSGRRAIIDHYGRNDATVREAMALGVTEAELREAGIDPPRTFPRIVRAVA